MVLSSASALSLQVFADACCALFLRRACMFVYEYKTNCWNLNERNETNAWIAFCGFYVWSNVNYRTKNILYLFILCAFEQNRAPNRRSSHGAHAHREKIYYLCRQNGDCVCENRIDWKRVGLCFGHNIEIFVCAFVKANMAFENVVCMWITGHWWLRLCFF